LRGDDDNDDDGGGLLSGAVRPIFVWTYSGTSLQAYVFKLVFIISYGQNDIVGCESMSIMLLAVSSAPCQLLLCRSGRQTTPTNCRRRRSSTATGFATRMTLRRSAAPTAANTSKSPLPPTGLAPSLTESVHWILHSDIVEFTQRETESEKIRTRVKERKSIYIAPF